jgi:VacB/RNase II family 3'-5' exoribonuclease
MIERGFIPEFSKDVLIELASITAPAKAKIIPAFRDMRELLWVSIDNDDSRDLDQLTYAEDNRIYVAIADVDAIVKKGLPIDIQAAHNTTSIYTPTVVFPMLPLKLSNDLTSLNENTDRCANVVEMELEGDGRFHLISIYPALVRNRAKLTYHNVAGCVEKGICLGHLIPSIPGLVKQLALQDRIAQRIQAFRNAQGALEFGIAELQAVVVDGIPVGLQERTQNRAHKLIENYMIAANVCVTEFLHKNHLPTLRRVVKIPKRWNRIVSIAKILGEDLPAKPDPKALRAFLLRQKEKNPASFPELSLAVIKLIGRGEYILSSIHGKDLGHFNLAELEYAHTTAPNRRYPDVIMQRLLKSHLYGEPSPYTKSELAAIAAHCTVKESDAEKVERRLVKCAAAMVLAKEIGRQYKAMVTGKTERGTWVRLMEFPVEGKLVQGDRDLDVGDYLLVKLDHVDILKGFIDFRQ